MDDVFDKLAQTSGWNVDSARMNRGQKQKEYNRESDHDTASDMKNEDPAIVYISQNQSVFSQTSVAAHCPNIAGPSSPLQRSQRVYERKSAAITPQQAKMLLLSCSQSGSLLNMPTITSGAIAQTCSYSTAASKLDQNQLVEDSSLKRNRQHLEWSTSETVSDRPSKRFFKNIRQWEWTEFGKSQIFTRKHKQEGVEFSLVSYNVLAQNLLEDNSYLYDWSQKNVLDWSSRKRRLLNEIKNMGCPDVLCLQEVYNLHYSDFFLPELTKLGYAGLYQKRTGDKQDGCATFYKRDKFKLEEEVRVKYYKPEGKSLLDRDNVAIIVKLCPVGGSSENDCICIANTHLLYNPRRGDIKLAQLMILLAEIDKIAHVKQSSSQSVVHIPTIMCGDFNTEPFSDLYSLIVNGYLQYEGLLIKQISGQKEGRRGRENFLSREFFPRNLKITDQCRYAHLCSDHHYSPTDCQQTLSEPPDSVALNREQESDMSSTSSQMSHGDDQDSSSQENVENISYINYNSGSLWHDLNFVSVYKHTVERLKNKKAEVTTHHMAGSCTVDFMFYNVNHRDMTSYQKTPNSANTKEGRLRLMGRYGLMAEKELDCLPNKYHASDHLPLLAKFLLQRSTSVV